MWLGSLHCSWRLLEIGAPPPAVQLAQTSKVEIWRRGKARLYRDSGSPSHRIPVLLVPNLAMSRSDIFDLQPGVSLVEFMLNRGFDFYLLDWGVSV